MSLSACQSGEIILPEATLEPITGLTLNSGWAVPAVDTRRFANRTTVLNVWATWCPICRSEHDMLKRLSGDGRITLAGLVHKDKEDNVRSYLRSAGNPFAALSMDANGLLFRALRQRGVPYTHVIGRDRRVLASHIGGLTDEAIAQVIEPAIRQALAQPAA